MNVSFQSIIKEYRNKVDELTYTNVCQQLAIKLLEETQKELEGKIVQAEANVEAESKRATEAENRLNPQVTEVLEDHELPET